MNISEVLRSMKEALDSEFVCPFFPGFYDSIFDVSADTDLDQALFDNSDAVEPELLDYVMVNYEVTREYCDEVGKAYLRHFVNLVKEALPKFEAEFVEIDSPNEYNYTTDRLIGKCDFEANKEDIKAFVEKHKEEFDKVVKENFTSYDGFISFYSNDINEWDLDSLDHNELGTVLECVALVANDGVDPSEALEEMTCTDVPTGVGIEVDFADMAEKFDLPFIPTSLDDLEYMKKVDGKYVYTKDAPGQLKLDLNDEE